MGNEREAALDLFFKVTSRPRSAPAATVLVSEALDGLIAALRMGSALATKHGTPAREDADRAVRDAAVALGRTTVHALQGPIASGLLEDVAMPRREALTSDARPLDARWQQQEDSYAALGAIAVAQRARLDALAKQPYQLYRRLHEAIALAADAAAWTAWVDV